MDSVFGDFDNLKISALSKSKSLNEYINNVTIGPNSTFLDKTTKNESMNQSPKTVSKTTQTKSINLLETNRRTSKGKVLTELEVQVKDDIEVRSSIKSFSLIVDNICGFFFY